MSLSRFNGTEWETVRSSESEAEIEFEPPLKMEKRDTNNEDLDKEEEEEDDENKSEHSEEQQEEEDEGDESDLPDAATCLSLTEKFAELTGTDVACAHFFLQDRKWDLERSVNAYFSSTKKVGIHVLDDGDERDVVINFKPTNFIPKGHRTNVPPNKFNIISWNIDGLDEKNIKTRTLEICKIIYREEPDVVFLQEVVPHTMSFIEENLPEYICIPSGSSDYFVATLLRKFTIYKESQQIIPHTSSLMGRNMLIVQAYMGNFKVKLINSHLESTADHAAERVKQLKTCFRHITDTPENYTVIVGGDLNLRDNEVPLAGGLPNGVVDLWQACGARREAQYTWDMTRNHNHTMPGRFQPRCRFDRLYLRHSSKKRATPKLFGLEGIKKVPNHQCFPSDHWAIRVFFEIDHSN